jgi:hypothetical protein
MQTTPAEHGERLGCQVAMLGLHLDDCDMFNEIMRRCRSCDCLVPCLLDLKRDPKNPVWEVAGTIIA